MSALKRLSVIGRGGTLRGGLYFVVLTSAILTSPAVIPFHSARAAIDETFPDSIPAEIVADWKDQDIGGASNYAQKAEEIVYTLPAQYAQKYTAEKAGLSGEKLYLLARHYRRVSAMKKHDADLERIIFARHHNFGGIFVGYHDNSDPKNSDIAWSPQSALCLLNMKNYYSPYTEILTRSDCVIRDPCVSFDGKKVLVAISGKRKGTGYKIYETTIADPQMLRQLTFDDGLSEDSFTVSDFEPCYLPSGDIMFTSTRNFGMSAHAPVPTTNMFVMNKDGKFMRRVGFDQANTFYPVLMDDGSVLYSRWEYNDRDITNCMGLFSMHPDGTHQTEWFGNQTPWPFTMLHARPIPNTYTKVMCVAGGHHGPYAGELVIIDVLRGANGTQSIKMVAPVREAKPDFSRDDKVMGGVKFLFQNPYPLDDSLFLVSWRKSEMADGGSGSVGSSFDGKFGLYFMHIDGTRELLAWAAQSMSQPVSVKPRDPAPPRIEERVNFNDSLGEFYMQDVYAGEGMKGVAKGAAKSLRVVALHYRAAGGSFGMTLGSAPSGLFSSSIICPVSAYGASWEAKEVLGEAKIYPDGSAAFKVPARTPVYFQVIDTNGYCIATMRSWSTLMPGEKFACVGCHEDKIPPPPGTSPQAGEAKKLDAPLGIENNPFDYNRMVQPIFTAKCIGCHTANHSSGFDLRGDTMSSSASKKWTKSYISLLKLIGAQSSNDALNICTIFSQPPQQPPRSFGSSLSGIMTKGGMSGNHHDVRVTETEKKTVACWIDLCAPYCGKYNSSMSASDSIAYERLLDKRAKWAALEKKNITVGVAAAAVMPDSRRNAKSVRAGTERIGFRYVPARRALVVDKSSRCIVTITDLRGRVIFRTRPSIKKTGGEGTVVLPSHWGRGLYMAELAGVNGISRAKIAVTR